MGLVVQQLLYLHMVLPWNVVHFGFITLLGCTRVLSAMLHSVKREVKLEFLYSCSLFPAYTLFKHCE